jgi:glycosyltransferase involved in cell wall biosynthesis
MQALPGALVVKPHGSLDPFLYRVRRWCKSIPEWLIVRPALRAAAAVHFTASEELELARATGAFGRWAGARSAKAIIVREGVDLEYDDGGAARDFLQTYPGLAGRRIILFLGRINFKKGLDILARAFGQISRMRPDTHLVLAGPDSEDYGAKVRRWLGQEGVLDRTTFTGMLHGRIKRGAYETASVFVLPSYTENFGLTIVEASAYGVPVVVSTKVNIWREILAANCGLMTECDAEHVAAAVLSLLDDSEAARAIAARGPLFAKTFGWESVVADMLAEYRKIITVCAVSR